jgi:hypothetical protein
MNGAIPPLPNTPSWSGAQLKHRAFLLNSYLKPIEQSIFNGLSRHLFITTMRTLTYKTLQYYNTYNKSNNH